MLENLQPSPHYHHFEAGPTRSGMHPIGEMALYAAMADIQSGVKDSEHLKYLEKVANLNAKYAPQLSTVADKVWADGFTPDPMYVLGSDDFDTATSIIYPKTDMRAYAYNGVILIRDDPRAAHNFGPDWIIGIGLHEEAHAQSSHDHKRIYSHTPADGSDRDPSLDVRRDSGFSRSATNSETGETRSLGAFLEEGFADLYRVRASTELGLDSKLPGKVATVHAERDIPNIRFVGEGRYEQLVNPDDGSIAMPAKFAIGASIEHQAVDTGISTIAAYGLDLIDRHVPGFYDDLKRARSDPKAFTEAVHKIESVQPGLYQDLRDLSQNPTEFYNGFTKIVSGLNVFEDMVFD